MICHSLRADFWIMSSWGCPSCHFHRTGMVELRPLCFIDLYVASLHGDIMNAHGPTLSQFVRNVSKTLNHPYMSSKLLGYH